MKPHLIAIFSSPNQAEQAFYALQSYVQPDDISIVHLAPGDTSTRDLSADTVADGIGIGALAGGGLGFAIGMSSLLIPGLGPVLAFGPIISTLVGMTAGGITGGFVDIGVNRYTAEEMSAHVQGGKVVMTVAVPNASLREPIEEMLRQHGAESVREEVVQISHDVEPQELG